MKGEKNILIYYERHSQLQVGEVSSSRNSDDNQSSNQTNNVTNAGGNDMTNNVSAVPMHAAEAVTYQSGRGTLVRRSPVNCPLPRCSSGTANPARNYNSSQTSDGSIGFLSLL